jgi:transcriptional regulator with XRE-family HTH domain
LIVKIFQPFIIEQLAKMLITMTNIRDILANNLKGYRRKSGFSQAKLAEKADISTQYIAMIELSRQFPTPDVLDKIALALGIETYELFAVAPTPENAMERLHRDIIKEVREVIVEELEKTLAYKHKD